MLDDIMKAISSATYKSKDVDWEHHIVYKDEHLNILRIAIEEVVNKHVEKEKQLEVEIAKLSAKVFAYEAIISNSNFAAVMELKEKE